MVKMLWIDTETTGVDAEKNEIIQIAGIIETPGSMNEFDITMRPTDFDNIHPKAIESHGISIKTMRTYIDPHTAYLGFKGLLSDYIDPYDKTDKFYLCGQNVKFDSDMVRSWFIRNDDPYWFSFVHSAMFDLMTLAAMFEIRMGKKIFPNYKLGVICETLKVELTNAHDALADIKATRECCMRLWVQIVEAK